MFYLSKLSCVLKSSVPWWSRAAIISVLTLSIEQRNRIFENVTLNFVQRGQKHQSDKNSFYIPYSHSDKCIAALCKTVLSKSPNQGSQLALSALAFFVWVPLDAIENKGVRFKCL